MNWYFKIYFTGVRFDSLHKVNLLPEWKLGDRRFNITFNNETCQKAEIIQLAQIIVFVSLRLLAKVQLRMLEKC